MSPRLSVVVPSHNRVDLLRLALAGIARHATVGVEVIVVDDGSVDGCVGATAAQFAGVRVLRFERRSGFCVAANAGVRLATAPVVQLLNDDAEVTAGWDEAGLRPFTEPSVAAVAPLVLIWPGDDASPRVDSAGDRYFLGGIAGKRGHGRPLSAEFLRPGPVFGASASSAFYRRDSFVAAGGFPDAFGAYFEDVDLSFRLHQAGGRIVYEPACRIVHRVGASHGRPSGTLLSQQSRNEELLFWRNTPTGMMARALPLHCAVLAAKAWRRWREGTLRPWLCGRFRVLGEIPALWAHRRRLQAAGMANGFERWGVERRFWSER